MKVKVIFILSFLISLQGYSQLNYDSIIKPRKELLFSKVDSNYKVSKTLKNIDLNFLCDIKTVRKFNKLVFRYTNHKSKKTHYLNQWNNDIVICFDKKIPKKVIKKFKDFYSQLDTVKNLKIDYTNNIEKANYLFKVSDEIITEHLKEYKFKSQNEKVNHPLYNVFYELLTDGNKKFYSAIINININKLNNNLILKKIKQVFYASLGNFSIYTKIDSNSLLSSKYNSNTRILTDDLYFIDNFYKIKFEQSVDGTTFSKLIRLAKKKCRK